MVREIQKSEEFSKRSGRRTRRQMATAVRDTLLVGAAVAGAQALHLHPDTLHQLPGIVSDPLTFGANMLHGTSNVLGSLIEKVPGMNYLPRLAEAQLPIKSYITEPSLTIVEAYGIEELGRRTWWQIRQNKRFREEAAEMRHIDRTVSGAHRGIALADRKAKWVLPFGRPKVAAEKAIANPSGKWNKARIQESVRHSFREATKADEGKMKLLSPRGAALVGGEVIEQGSKLIPSVRHVGAAFASGLGVFFWAVSHIGFTMPEARKIGSNELRKLSWSLFVPSFIPGPTGVITSVLLTFPLEHQIKKYHEQIYPFLVGNIVKGRGGEIAGNLVRATLQEPEVAEAARKIGKIVKDLEAKNDANPLAREYNRQIQLLQSGTWDAGNRRLPTKRERKIIKQGGMEGRMQKLEDLEGKPLPVRIIREGGMRRLSKQIEEYHRAINSLMHGKAERVTYESQLAGALQTITQKYGQAPLPQAQ